MDTKHASTPPHRPERGLTLVETAVALAVLAIVAATAAPSFGAFIDGRRLEGAATQLAADVRFARSEALSRNRPIRLSLQSTAASTCWVLHTGSAGQCRCADAGPALCTADAVEIKTVVLPGAHRVAATANVGSIVFDPLHGTSTPAGTLRLADGRGRAIHHVVNVTGRLRSCSPGAALAGYRPC